jgi:flagellar biosynthesis/type III secretory pathway chaperone
MTPPAARALQSPLEIALLDVHATLADLLVAADEQHAAVMAGDSQRLERVTRQQERLSARLANAEAQRLELTAGTTFEAAAASLPGVQAARVKDLATTIAHAVRDLKDKQANTAGLLRQSIELTEQTLNFLQRLVTPQTATYGLSGLPATRQSLLVDGRA